MIFKNPSIIHLDRLKTNSLSSLTKRTPIYNQISPQFPPNSKLKSLCINGRLKEALLEMAIQREDVNFEGYDSLLNECVKQKAIGEGQRVHAHMIKTNYIPPIYLKTRLMVLYVKCDFLGHARKVFDEMSERNVVSWTALISAYSHRGYCMEALNLFLRMLETDVPPNEFTFATVLTLCTGPCGLEHGRQVHSLVVKSNFESHIFVGSSLLDMYAKSGKIDESRCIFDKLPKKDVVSCTAIISGYAQLGLDEEALVLFRQLQKEGMKSNYVTFSSILTALSGLAALDYGRQVHNQIIRSELPYYVVLQNSLIDMYSKCGCLTYSTRVFDNTSERTVITWNAMIVGYGKHGFGREVLELFKLMRQHKEVKPNSVTYMAVLSGCSHGGLIAEGLGIFESMLSEVDVEPGIEHYGCVVDLLGRAGRLDEAFSMINCMPFEPTAAIWGSLLGACRAHINVSIGEFVAQQLFKMEPENAGNYIILSNIYAAAGRWEDVISVRKLMKEKMVMKDPARSWIKLNQTVHTFHVNDRFHPRKEEIYAKVRELCIKIKEAGYVPDMSCVLHDVDDEQKDRMLLGHSEKLAMALGMMGSQGVLIRIVNNIRVCVDCHNFAKFVSKVCGREISIRDKNRFHHFVGGICSCGDYW